MMIAAANGAEVEPNPAVDDPEAFLNRDLMADPGQQNTDSGNRELREALGLPVR